MRAFVTGAAGFIGSNLLRHLAQTPGIEKVYGLTRRDPVDWNHPAEPLVGSLEEIEGWAGELLECGLVFHLAADASPYAGAEASRINLEGSRRLFETLGRGTKLEKLVFTSSILATGREAGDRCLNPIGPRSPASPTTEYGRSKLACERALQDSSLPHTILRPGLVYGRGMRIDSHLSRFASWVRSGALATHVAYPGRVSLIHVDDLCHAMIQARTEEGTVFVAWTETLTLASVFSALHRRIHGKEPWRVKVPIVGRVLRRTHAITGYEAAFAFADYLWAEDPAFRHAFFAKRAPKLLADHLDDVLSG